MDLQSGKRVVDDANESGGELAQFLPRNTPSLLLPAALRTTCKIRCESSITTEFSHALGTYLSFAGSTPQSGSSALEEVPVGSVVLERVGVHDLRGVFHPRPHGTDYGIYSRFVNHDLTSGKFRIDSRSWDV